MNQIFEKILIADLKESQLEELRGIKLDTNAGIGKVDWKQGHVNNYYWSDLSGNEIYPTWYLREVTPEPPLSFTEWYNKWICVASDPKINLLEAFEAGLKAKIEAKLF